MIRVAIAAPYASVRAGLAALLEEAPDVQVVGAAPASELATLLADGCADVVLAEVEGDHTALVVETERAGAALVSLADGRAGIASLAASSLRGWAYLSREAEGPEILAAVRAAAVGLAAVEARLSGELAAPPRPAEGALAEPLTAREREVLQLMALGLPNKGIAARLGISQHTAKYHVAAVLSKLGAASRTEAVAIGARQGMVAL